MDTKQLILERFFLGAMQAMLEHEDDKVAYTINLGPHKVTFNIEFAHTELIEGKGEAEE